ncbi:hypothetical protein [Streptomyces sp. SBT349]|uniref:hypothetical protein n=1 Tax=Streptomyces sp. SBT349 TaxID=1580539 RepID=UPI00066E8A9A|nr:hypothetical protein [Streptomyces sp. SBT349]
MASIRTARALTVMAAVPLLLGVAGGVAQAIDTQAITDITTAWGSGNQGLVGSGVGDDNAGNSATTQQSAIGSGATNESNTAGVVGPAVSAIDQSDKVYTIVFGALR